jgi:hypothetical protein
VIIPGSLVRAEIPMGRLDGTRKVDPSLYLARQQDCVRAWRSELVLVLVPNGGFVRLPTTLPSGLHWPWYHVA